MSRRLLPAACLLLVLVTAAACGSKDEAAPAFTIPGNPNISIPGGAGSSSTTVPLTCTPTTVTHPADASKPPVAAIPAPLPTTLQTTDIKQGEGPAAAAGDQVSVAYVGALAKDGTEFDTSYTRKQPFTVGLGQGQVIPGWDQGLVGMKPGGVRQLVIPPDLAYGQQGSPPKIGPNETLVFVVEMLQVCQPAAATATTAPSATATSASVGTAVPGSTPNG